MARTKRSLAPPAPSSSNRMARGSIVDVGWEELGAALDDGPRDTGFVGLGQWLEANLDTIQGLLHHLPPPDPCQIVERVHDPERTDAQASRRADVVGDPALDAFEGCELNRAAACLAWSSRQVAETESKKWHGERVERGENHLAVFARSRLAAVLAHQLDDHAVVAGVVEPATPALPGHQIALGGAVEVGDRRRERLLAATSDARWKLIRAGEDPARRRVVVRRPPPARSRARGSPATPSSRRDRGPPPGRRCPRAAGDSGPCGCETRRAGASRRSCAASRRSLAGPRAAARRGSARVAAARTTGRPRAACARCAGALRSTPRSRTTRSARARRRQPAGPRAPSPAAPGGRESAGARGRPGRARPPAGRRWPRTDADRAALGRRRGGPTAATPPPGNARWRGASETGEETKPGARARAPPRRLSWRCERCVGVGLPRCRLAPGSHCDEASGDRPRRQPVELREAPRPVRGSAVRRIAPRIRRSSRLTSVSRPRGLWIA